MAVPSFEGFMLPVLQLAGDNQIHDLHVTVQKMPQRFNLSEEDKNELLPSGKQTRFANRVSWAVTYLKKSKLIQSQGGASSLLQNERKKLCGSLLQRLISLFLNNFLNIGNLKTGGNQRKMEASLIYRSNPRSRPLKNCWIPVIRAFINS